MTNIIDITPRLKPKKGYLSLASNQLVKEHETSMRMLKRRILVELQNGSMTVQDMEAMGLSKGARLLHAVTQLMAEDLIECAPWCDGKGYWVNLYCLKRGGTAA